MIEKPLLGEHKMKTSRTKLNSPLLNVGDHIDEAAPGNRVGRPMSDFIGMPSAQTTVPKRSRTATVQFTDEFDTLIVVEGPRNGRVETETRQKILPVSGGRPGPRQIATETF